MRGIYSGCALINKRLAVRPHLRGKILRLTQKCSGLNRVPTYIACRRCQPYQFRFKRPVCLSVIGLLDISFKSLSDGGAFVVGIVVLFHAYALIVVIGFLSLTGKVRSICLHNLLIGHVVNSYHMFNFYNNN